jgi:hypothetical protein
MLLTPPGNPNDRTFRFIAFNENEAPFSSSPGKFAFPEPGSKTTDGDLQALRRTIPQLQESGFDPKKDIRGKYFSSAALSSTCLR